MQKGIQTFAALLLCLFLAQGAMAQGAAFGVKAGVNISNFNVSFDNADLDTDGVTNLQIGLLLDLPLASIISIQPELNYIARGFSVNDGFSGITQSYKANLGYLDLGGLLKLRFGQPDGGLGFYIGAGPFFSYAISGQEEIGDTENDIDFDDRNLKRTDVSVAGALGLTFGSDFRFFLDGRYMAGLGNISDLDDAELRSNGIGITAGVMVPLGY